MRCRDDRRPRRSSPRNPAGAGTSIQRAMRAAGRDHATGRETPGGRLMSQDKTTWQPHTERGELSTQDKNQLPESAFAFPRQRKEPLTDASHVRNAMARFDQVEDVSDADRELAWRNILKAAEHFGVEVHERDWRELGREPHTEHHAH